MVSPVPGLAQERTWLAWRRTTAACVVLTLVVVRVSWIEGPAVLGLPALVLLATGAWMVVSVLSRRRWTTKALADVSYEVVGDGRVPASVALVVGAVAGVVVLLAWS